ncbi:MAG: hypothetical protein V4737_03460 [Curtobacterium sp.]
MSTTAAPQAPAASTPTEVDFRFDVDNIASLIAALPDAEQRELFRKIGVRRAPKPRTPAADAKPYTPNTGDPRLDAFMAAHHDPKWKPKAIPKPASLKGPHPNSVGAFEGDAARALRKRGYTVERDGYGGWKVAGGDGSYERQLTAAYVPTSEGWKHPDDVEATDR